MSKKQEVRKNSKKEKVEKFIGRYLVDEFILFKIGLECSLLNSYPAYNHKYWAVRIIALRDAIKEVGIWKKFYRKNKEDINRVSKRVWIANYWVKGVPRYEKSYYQHYLEVKKLIKEDLILLHDLSHGRI